MPSYIELYCKYQATKVCGFIHEVLALGYRQKRVLRVNRPERKDAKLSICVFIRSDKM